MKGHLGALLTLGLAAIALVLAVLQASVVARSGLHYTTAASEPRSGPSNRFSVPGGRSGIPWGPADKIQPNPGEGRTPPRQQEEQHRSLPPPSRYRGYPPHLGPQPPRKAAA